MKYQELLDKMEALIDDQSKPEIAVLAEASAVLKKIEEKKQEKKQKKEKKPNKEKQKSNRPDRTIESMFRITATNSQRLSDQADTKAHIMISVNSFIIPVLFVVRNMDNGAKLTVPILALLTVSLMTIIFAVLATRPRIPAGTFTPEDLDEKKVDLLFFGNFFKMSFEEYSNGMFRIMDDKFFLHLTLLRDIYSQGLVLGRKYRMLTVAYNVFMFGLILSVLTFIWALV